MKINHCLKIIASGLGTKIFIEFILKIEFLQHPLELSLVNVLWEVIEN